MSAEMIGELIQLESEHIKPLSPHFRCVCSLVYDISLFTKKSNVCMNVYICLYIC